MADLVARIDRTCRCFLRRGLFADRCIPLSAAPLAAHLESENVEFMQFAFRWMNCLLMREISVQNTIRMWDTYLVGPRGVYHSEGRTEHRVIGAGRGHRCFLSVSSICLFGLPGEVE